jgi:hypothetical protein
MTMSTGGEKAWVKELQPKLQVALQGLSFGDVRVGVETSHRLPYAFEILDYNKRSPGKTRTAGYQTDMLVWDEHADGTWVPRVVVECKLGSVTTHDALTYSAKANTHKHVHPYLRYGILIGNYGEVVPSRLIRHGAYFDFMTVWGRAAASGDEWQMLIDVLTEEVRASRKLRELLGRTSKEHKPFRLLHRPLVFK